MARKPDLASMTLTKARAAETVPFAAEEPRPSPPTAQPSSAEVALLPKALTIKLSGRAYAALRDRCHQLEKERGKRVTHQEVVAKLIHEWLGVEE